MEMGASGVQMGTRFVATHECDADPVFKQSYVDAREEDLMVIKSPVGLPGRALKNQFLMDVAAGARRPFRCPYHCIKTCDPEKQPLLHRHGPGIGPARQAEKRIRLCRCQCLPRGQNRLRSGVDRFAGGQLRVGNGLGPMTCPNACPTITGRLV